MLGVVGLAYAGVGGLLLLAGDRPLTELAAPHVLLAATAVVVCAAVAALGLMGCEWDTGSDAENWSSSYDWVNFSGVYRGASGGLLVTDYTTTPALPGSTNVVTLSNDSQGSFALGQSSFSGTLDHGNVVPGSVVITLYSNGGEALRSFSDDGNGVLGTSEGTIQYVSGSWTIRSNVLFPPLMSTLSSSCWGRRSARLTPAWATPRALSWRRWSLSR